MGIKWDLQKKPGLSMIYWSKRKGKMAEPLSCGPSFEFLSTEVIVIEHICVEYMTVGIIGCGVRCHCHRTSHHAAEPKCLSSELLKTSHMLPMRCCLKTPLNVTL